MTTADPLLLDTCALIFIAEGAQLARPAAAAISTAGEAGELYLSPVSAWELGKAVASRKLNIAKEPLAYFEAFLQAIGARLCPMETDVLVASSFLPGRIHRDPMDRILIQTARHNNMTLLTRDRKILAYGAEGHVKVMAC